jgi:hypothetical protein
MKKKDVKNTLSDISKQELINLFEQSVLEVFDKTILKPKITLQVFDDVVKPTEDMKQFDTERKHYPVNQGLFKYFPKALMYVSHVSWKGGDKHHPGEPVHWDRNKSKDDPDALGRHLLDEGEYDEDGLLYEGKVAWRALAVLEKKLEKMNFKI